MRAGFVLIAIGSVLAIYFGILFTHTGGPGDGSPSVGWNTIAFYGGVFLVFCGLVRLGWNVGQNDRRGDR